jgi:hypothetical protein
MQTILWEAVPVVKMTDQPIIIKQKRNKHGLLYYSTIVSEPNLMTLYAGTIIKIFLINRYSVVIKLKA